MSIKVNGGNVRFREECDKYFEVNMTAQEAKKTLKDAIAFIEEMENEQCR